MRVLKEADKNFNSKGIRLYIHHVEGIASRKDVRVGYLIQFGKYVVKSKGGLFCFFATKGVKPMKLLGIKKKDQATATPPDSIPIDDGVNWEKNFYQMISHYNEIGLKKPLDVVLLYLELKEGVRPSMGSTIDKSLLEEEYILLGYTTFRLCDD